MMMMMMMYFFRCTNSTPDKRTSGDTSSGWESKHFPSRLYLLWRLFIQIILWYICSPLQVRYIPTDLQQLFEKDKVTFYYYYDQVIMIVMVMTMTSWHWMMWWWRGCVWVLWKGKEDPKPSFPPHKEGKVAQGLKSLHFPNDDDVDVLDVEFNEDVLDDDGDDNDVDETKLQVRNDYLKKNFESLDLDTAIQLCCIEIRRFGF